MFFSICAHLGEASFGRRARHCWLSPSAVLDAQVPPGPRAIPPIDDDDELSDLEFAIADMMAAADAANMEEEPITERSQQASGSADRPRTKKARLAGTQAAPPAPAPKAKRKQAGKPKAKPKAVPAHVALSGGSSSSPSFRSSPSSSSDDLASSNSDKHTVEAGFMFEPGGAIVRCNERNNAAENEGNQGTKERKRKRKREKERNKEDTREK